MQLLLVEDEERIRVRLGRCLEARGFRVSQANSIREAEVRLQVSPFDVVLVDRGLPDGDGVELCRARRDLGDRTPFVVLSGMTAEREVVDGYGAEVDLYLRKPLGADEIAAHLKALLRRVDRPLVSVGPLTFDRARGRVILPDSIAVSLSLLERVVLEELVRSADQVVSRESIVEAIWGQIGPDSNALDALVARLRRKLGASSWMLETRRRQGFVLHTRSRRSA